ncbi:MAG: rhodanese-like domain-containing protein [Erythrobacter sp.]
MQVRKAAISIMAASLCLAACTQGNAASDEVADAVQDQIVDLSVAELQNLQASGNVRLIDVRRDSEVAQGMIPGAEHIALDEFDPAKLDLSDGREIVLYCRAGVRSRVAGERLSAHTGAPAKHLSGGIIDWKDAGEPVDRP